MYPRGQVQTGRGEPVRSLPTLHWASTPQGLGEQRVAGGGPAPEVPPLTNPRLPPGPTGLVLADLRQVPPLSALGSPSVPGGQEHSARWLTALQSAVGLQQGPPPQKVGPQGSMQVES